MGGAGRDKGKPGGGVCLSGCGRELAARMLEGALGWVHWQLEELLQGHRGGAWVHKEVGRGDGAPCQPGWHRQDRGLPTIASTTPLLLRLRLRAGFVGVTQCWPQGPGLLPWFRGEADSMPAALSYSGSWEEHVLDRFMQGGTGHMRRMAGPGLGQSPSGGRQTFQEACLSIQPAQLLRGFVSVKCDSPYRCEDLRLRMGLEGEWRSRPGAGHFAQVPSFNRDEF